MKQPRRTSARRDVLGTAGRQKAQTTGAVKMTEYAIGVHQRIARAVIIGSAGPQGGISTNPTHAIAYRIRAALNPRIPQRAPVVLFDAEGKRIGTMDPYSRERRLDT